jgi:hypothetical protein
MMHNQQPLHPTNLYNPQIHRKFSSSFTENQFFSLKPNYETAFSMNNVIRNINNISGKQTNSNIQGTQSNNSNMNLISLSAQKTHKVTKSESFNFTNPQKPEKNLINLEDVISYFLLIF